MLRIAALTSGYNIPSARFRIRQHIPFLKKHGVYVTEYKTYNNKYNLIEKLSKIHNINFTPIVAMRSITRLLMRIPGIIGTYKNDITWIERNFLPHFDFLVQLSSNSFRILDVDDSIWIGCFNAERSAKILAKNVDSVIAGNNFIAEWYSKYCKKVYVIPTAIDCDRFKPLIIELKEPKKNKFLLGWTGTSGNFKYLKVIEKSLSRFLIRHNDASALIIADREPSFKIIPKSKVTFVKWTPENEVSTLQKIDVGIMPLIEDEWTLGKCSFKMLQYMAVGVPVVVSPIGMNREVLEKGEFGFGAKNEDDWYDALELLYYNQSLRSKMGLHGRSIVLSEFNTKIITKKLINIFTGASIN